MKIKLFVLCLGTLFSYKAFSIEGKTSFGNKIKPESYQFSVFNNQYYFPITGMGNLFTSKYHPGISAGFCKTIKQKKKGTFYYDAKLGVYHHRFIQTGIQVYGDLGYRFNFAKSYFIATEFGLGYLHAIIHQKSFKTDGEGNYSKVKNFGKPQIMTGLGLKFGKKIEIKHMNGRLFLNYQPWFQLPFIKSYVPLLPNNSVHLGFDFLINRS